MKDRPSRTAQGANRAIAAARRLPEDHAMAIGLIIFDCDGVLIDSESIACRVVAETLTDAGYPLQTHDILEFVGKSSRDMYDRLAARFGRQLPDDLDATLGARLRQAFAAELKPMPGVDALLRAHAGSRRCVASSSSPERIRHSLGCTGLLAHFGDGLYSASMVARGKPAPDLFLHAASSMGAAPVHCVVIEDSVPGIAAARAAGMLAIGFTGGSHCDAAHAARLELAGAAPIAGSMAALDALLRDL
jgi:HAD superfamily hydrolase (TIGR01509 family)